MPGAAKVAVSSSVQRCAVARVSATTKAMAKEMAEIDPIVLAFSGARWVAMAAAKQWLALSNNELHYGVQWGRGLKIGIRSVGDYNEYANYARNGLAVLEKRLKSNEWLACGRLTIADLACYCYTSVAPEGGFDLQAHPSVAAWVKRVEALPGWIKRV